MLFALGAASSAIDALKSLTSSKSSSRKPPALGQNATSPFDLLSVELRRLRPARARAPVRRRRFADIAGDHERAARCAKPVLDRIDARHPRAAPTR